MLGKKVVFLKRHMVFMNNLVNIGSLIHLLLNQRLRVSE